MFILTFNTCVIMHALKTYVTKEEHVSAADALCKKICLIKRHGNLFRRVTLAEYVESCVVKTQLK